MKYSILFAVALLVFSSARGAEHPNIVVFLVDDMGVMDTSVPFLVDSSGKPESHPLNKLFRTPSMERLSANGIRMSSFYANSVCSPTRVSIMTGQSSARHRTTQWIRPEGNNAGPQGPKDWQWKGITPRHITLPALLKKKEAGEPIAAIPASSRSPSPSGEALSTITASPSAKRDSSSISAGSAERIRSAPP